MRRTTQNQIHILICMIQLYITSGIWFIWGTENLIFHDNNFI